ncbi:heterokaryon incompatibility protein-domain-containing protein [Apodospora peruviana]|uniref:Heterokaryon incompatibility protein-domain-containing protein n=1 Tax=Apodospora peruviana TaxID=516989 RepID=A0AAE0IU01_9PEZI|nr:heterokaryon incompatibility protein-domain-containing protein [Apodospora peruviana]
MYLHDLSTQVANNSNPIFYKPWVSSSASFGLNSKHQLISTPPLNSTNNEIRLLRLLPARSRASRIKGELFIASLENDPRPEYVALSYVWGKPTKVSKIHVGRERLGIARNLQRALKYIRPEQDEEPLVIWIDALCINQDDPEERGHQVQLMRKIYSKSIGTRSWLDVEVDPLPPSLRKSRPMAPISTLAPTTSSSGGLSSAYFLTHTGLACGFNKRCYLHPRWSSISVLARPPTTRSLFS